MNAIENESAVPNRVPPEPGRMRAFGLALMMHLLLLGFLWIGVSWQNVTPVAVEAEIWSPTARTAAPPPPEPTPAPQPAKPEPVKPEPVKPPPKPVAEPVKPKQPDPDIALEKEKKRKELEKKLAEEKAERTKELEKKELEKKELEKKRLADEQEKKKLAEQEKKIQAEEQKRKQDEAAAEEKKKQAEEKKKQAEEQQRKQEEQQAEQRRKKQRDDDLKRLQAQAGDGTSGEAERSAAPKVSAGYAQKIGKMIKDATIMPPLTEISGNPAVEYEISLLPDGSVGNVRLLRSCGITAFDQAVRRAIERAAPYPQDAATGKVPSSLVISHRPKDH